MPESQMIINYVPNDECRVAIVEDGKLEELYAERFDAASHVGNIYVGKVINVEPAIQAAFVDFGLEDNGFLHVSDLHPRTSRARATRDRTGRAQDPPRTPPSSFAAATRSSSRSSRRAWAPRAPRSPATSPSRAASW